MRKGFTYFLLNGLRWVLPLFLLAIVSCSKTVDPTPVVPPPTPTPQTPSGVIDYFRMQDTLIGFNRTSNMSWLVSGTNSLTKVSIGGVYVGNAGAISTGVMKKDTVFTLSVNNGMEAKLKLRVADSILTLLWNDGKIAVREKTETLDTANIWRDTVIATPVSGKDQIAFLLTGKTVVTNNTGSYDAGRVLITPGDNTVMPAIPTILIWRNTNYTLLSIDAQRFILTRRGPDIYGNVVDWRETYRYY